MGEGSSRWFSGRRQRISGPGRSAPAGDDSVSSAFTFETLENRLLLSADFLPVDARISVPGETDVYTFTLTDHRELLFDARAAPEGLTWSLIGPDETLVDQRAFADSEIAEVASPVLSLGPGTYDVVVAAEGHDEVTGDYRFRLIDLADAQEVNPGEDVTVAQSEASEAQVFHFDGIETEEYRITGGDGPFKVSLIAPSGKVEASFPGLSDRVLSPLEETGRYRLVVEGDFDQEEADTATFLLRRQAGPLSDERAVEFATAPGTEMSGTLSGDDGRVHVHRFTLREDSWAVLEYRAVGVSVSLSGPAGEVDVASGQPVHLEAGAWELSFASARTSSHAYAAVLMTPDAVSEIELDEASNVRTFGESRAGAVSFRLDEPSALSFMAADNSDNNFLLMGPGGRVLHDGMARDMTVVPAIDAGEYLLVSRKRFASRPDVVSVEVEAAALAADALPHLDPGDVASGTIAPEGRAYFTYTGTGEPVMLDSIGQDQQLSWRRFGGDEVVTSPQSLRDPTVQTSGSAFWQGYMLPTQAGETYVVEVVNSGSEEKDFELALVSLADAPTLQIGDEVALAQDPGDRVGAVRLDLGDEETRAFVSAPVGFMAVVYDVEGAYLRAATSTFGADLSSYTGVVYLVFEAASQQPDPVEFTVSLESDAGIPPIRRTITPGEGPEPLTLGDGRNGATALKMQSGMLLELDLDGAADLAESFTLEGWFHIDRMTNQRVPLFEQRGATQRNLIVELRDDGSLRASARAGGGYASDTTDAGVMETGQWHHVALVADRDAGEMRLHVDGAQVASASRSGQGLGSLRPLEISSESTNNTNPIWGRIDRFVVRNEALDAAAIADIHATGATPGEQAIALALDFEDSDAPLAPSTGDAERVVLTGIPEGDDVVTGVLGTDESIRYEFTLDETTRLYFDNIVGTQPRLIRPDGGTTFFSEPGHVLVLDPGTYEIGFNSAGRHGFRLLDLADVPRMEINDGLQTVTLPGSGSSTLFEIEGLRDTILRTDYLSGSGAMRVALFADDGSLIERATSPVSFRNVQLPYDGRYWLAFEGPSTAAFNSPLTRIVGLLTGEPAPEAVDLGDLPAYAPAWTEMPDGSAALRLRGAETASFARAEIGDIGRQVTLSASFAVDGLERSRLLASLVADSGQEILSIGLDSNDRVFARALNAQDATTTRTATESSSRLIGEVIEVDAIIDRDEGRLFLYVDGERAASAAVSESWFDSPAELVLGGLPQHSGDERFHGVIGALRLRGDAADAATRADGHAGNWLGGDPELKLALDFSEGAGSLVFNRAAGGSSAEIAPLEDGIIFGRRDSRFDVIDYTLDLDEPGFFLLELLGSMRHRVEVIGPMDTLRSEQMTRGFHDRNGITLGAGSHILRFTSNGPPTGDFAFRLIDLAAEAQDITPGDAVTIESPAAELGRLFRFEAEAGRSYVVRDSDDNALDARMFAAEPDNETESGIAESMTARSDGVHYLYVANDHARAFAREITLYDRATRQGSLAPGVEANGTIPINTVDHRYAVSLESRTDLLVDALEGDGLRWQLLDAQGDQVESHNLSNSYGSSPRIMQVDPGEYTFRVYATGFNVRDADYRVVLRDARAEAEDITFNQEISTGPFEGSAIYSFEIDSRTDITRERLDGSWSWGSSAQLVSESGEIALSGNTIDAALNTPGRWYLILDEQVIFQIVQDGRSPTIGATEADFNTAGIGYVLDNQRGNEARLIEEDDGNRFLRMSALTDANAENVVFFDRVHDGELDAIEFAFDYRATAPESQASRGDGFTLGWLPSDTLGDTGARTFYSNNWSIRSDYEDALYLEFEISRDSQGDETNRIVLRRGGNTLATEDLGESLSDSDFARMRVEMAHATAGLEVSVHLARDGEEETILLDRAFIGDRFRLGEGRFAIEVATPSGNPADHDFDNIAITPTPQSGQDIVFGQTYNGTLEDIGGQNNYPADRYDFTVEAPSLVMFDGLNGGNSIRMEITGPGLDEGTQRFAWADPSDSRFRNALSLGPGSYSLYVEGQSGATGSYGFRLLNLDDATPMAADEDTSVALDPGNSTEVFSFDGTSGEKIFLETLGLDTGQVRLTLLDPDGERLETRPVSATSDGSLWPVELDRDGQYFVVVAGRYSEPDPKVIDLRLHRVETITTPLTFGETTRADIDLPGRERVFTFSLDEPDVVALEVESRLNSMFWEIRSTSGSVAAARSFGDTLSTHRLPPPVFSLDAGDYELVVTGLDRDETQENAIRLLAGSEAAALDKGASVTVPTVEEFNTRALDLSAIDVEADDPVLVASDTMEGVILHVLDRQGRSLTDQITTMSDMPLDLSGLSEGGYFLLIERFRRSGSEEATIALHPVPAPVAVTFGDRLQIDTVAAGTQRFAFSLDRRDFVQMDLLAADADTTWRLAGPDGLVLEGELSGFGSVNEHALWKLSEGDYILEIETGADAELILHSADEDVALEPGIPSDVRLDPANSSALRTLEGEAGQDVLLMLAAGDATGEMRVVSPDGREIAQSSLGTPLKLTLPTSDRYLVQISGSGSHSAPAQTARMIAITGLRPESVPMPRPDGASGPNLTVSDLRVDGSAASGQPLTLRWRTTNEGAEEASGALQERLVVRNLDTGALLDARLLDLDLDDAALAPGAGLERSATVALPAGDDGTGELAVQVITDAVNALAESAPDGLAEFDNVAALTVSAQEAAFPNLVLENIILPDPSEWGPGETVTLRWDAANRGNAVAEGPWTEQALLLQGRHRASANVVQVRDVVVSDNLGIDDTVQRSATFTLPEGEDAFDVFHFEVRLDSSGDVVESAPGVDAEADNIDSERVIATPHLALSDLRVLTDAPQAGEPLEFAFTVTNDGWMDAPGGHRHWLRIYNYDTGETQLEITLPGEAVAAGQSVEVTASVDMPLGAVGEIELRLILNRDIDGDRFFTELNPESGFSGYSANSDRIDFDAIAPQRADLAAGTVTAPADARVGEPVSISWSVENIGPVTTRESAWTDRVILTSNDTPGDAGDIILGEVAREDPLAAGDSYAASLDITLPPVDPGAWKIFVITDAGEVLDEPGTRDNNTSAASPIEIEVPDRNLDMVSVDLSADRVFSGSSVDVTWVVENIGTEDMPPGIVDHVYLTDSGVVDADSVLLAEVSLSEPLAAGESRSLSRSVDLPADASGALQIAVRTNATGVVAEAETSNNTASAGIEIQSRAAPDLVVTSVTAPQAANAGSVFDVSFTVGNIGAEAARGPWQDEILLVDADTGDHRRSLVSVDRDFDLLPGESYTVSRPVALPGLLSGSFRVAVTADSTGRVFEAGLDDNNTAKADDATLIGRPNLVAETLTAPASGVAGEDVDLSYDVANPTAFPVLGDRVDTLWLTRDGTIDGDAIRLADFSRDGDLDAQESASYSETITLPLGLTGPHVLV
ncbi:MAG: LEPR-XLL domain-containing protein, partial [Rhodobacteraceae bacterium]|nr:LEPR-XLL domain-containing protein [Paracoccaceae bacterium]